MTANVLGLSAFYHDSAAALVRDGEIVAAAQEERFTRRKHDPGFPRHAINYCLGEAFLEPSELDAIVFYDHPLLTLDRIVATMRSTSPDSEDQWIDAAPEILGVKAHVDRYVKRVLGSGETPLLFTEHHAAHAASAFFPSPFASSAILTMDGVGEWATTTIGVGNGSQIELQQELHFPHSLGLLYSAFTYYCGFKVNSGEYKLMGLAPYGEPRYVDLIREYLIDVKDDGSYRLNIGYFGFQDSFEMTNESFHELFGGAPRAPESRIGRREMDLAASIQAVTDDVVLRTSAHIRRQTGERNLVMAGGVALNCVANGLLERAEIFDHLWLQPAAGDAGGALGAALLLSHHRLGVPRVRGSKRDRQRGSYLGPSFSSAEVESFLTLHGYPATRVTASERATSVAAALADGAVVGYFVGRMEFGPRALGARSILGDPRNPEMQATMNLKIKYRESFRPFAPAVLSERADEFFDLKSESPYMLLVAPVLENRRKVGDEPLGGGHSDDLLSTVRRVRSDIPAVTHVDYSARVQTVDGRSKPDFHAVISEFERLTGYGLVVNTSFNVRGEPIVCTPQDAYRCFMHTEIDLLVLEDFILKKEDQPSTEADDSWGSQYEHD